MHNGKFQCHTATSCTYHYHLPSTFQMFNMSHKKEEAYLTLFSWKILEKTGKGNQMKALRLKAGGWHDIPILPSGGVRWNDPLSKSFDGSGRTDEDLPVYLKAALSFLTVIVTNCRFYFLFVCVLVCVCVRVKDVTYLLCIFRKSGVMNVHIFHQLNKIQNPVSNPFDRTVEVLHLFQFHTSITAGTSV